MAWLVRFPDLEARVADEHWDEEIDCIEGDIDSYQECSKVIGDIAADRAEDAQD